MSPLLLLLLSILPFITPQAHVSASPAQDYLSAHNQARSLVGVPPLKWSIPLATAASQIVTNQKTKNNCQFANLSSAGAATEYGANQLWTKGTNVVSPKMVVGAWVGEKRFYDYGRDSCVVNHQCGVYKQLVWRKSKELGCAMASCVQGGNSTLTVCFYNPPGNIVGEKPY